MGPPEPGSAPADAIGLLDAGPQADEPMLWRTDRLWHLLQPLLPGIGIEVLERAESTNTQLLSRARVRPQPAAESEAALVHRSLESRAFGRRADDHQPLLLVAEQQTHGRGRQGRVWQSARGRSLTFSLALPFAPSDWSGLSLAVGLAVADALDPPASRPPGAPPRIGLKWPNDLWLMNPGDAMAQGAPDQAPGRKLGGVLIETISTSTQGTRRHTVVGVGLNIAPLGAGAEQAEWLAAHACLREIDPSATPPKVLLQIAQPLVAMLLAFEREGFGPVMARYAERDLLDGHLVRTTAGDAPEGRAVGVSASGALRLDVGDRVLEITSGEVSVRLRDAPVTAPAPLSVDAPAAARRRDD